MHHLPRTFSPASSVIRIIASFCSISNLDKQLLYCTLNAPNGLSHPLAPVFSGAYPSNYLGQGADDKHKTQIRKYEILDGIIHPNPAGPARDV